MLNLSNYLITVIHCVENLYRVIANGVIENFNRVTRPVETNETVFIAVVFQQTIVNSSPVGMDNVFPFYPMLERRRHKYYFRLHAFSLAQNGAINNTPMSKERRRPLVGVFGATLLAIFHAKAQSTQREEGDRQQF
jgi:hypothetical protein